MVLQYPRTSIWKHSDQILNTSKLTLNTVKYWEYSSFLFTTPSNNHGDPWQLLAAIWECIRYRWIPLATLNTQIIFFLDVFSNRHEGVTKDGDHRPFVREHLLCLFEQIIPTYK